jgi:hypothetical protein
MSTIYFVHAAKSVVVAIATASHPTKITMDNEFLSAKIAAMEAKSPLVRRRSRR